MSQDKHFIKITGCASICAEPDTIELNMTAVVKNTDFIALNSNASVNDTELLAAISVLDIDVDALKTVAYSIDTEYEQVHTDGVYSRKFVGYSLTHARKLCFELDMKRLSAVLEALGKLTFALEYRVSFDVKDRAILADRLLALAVEDAHKKAKVLAKAAKVKLGDIITIDHSQSQPTHFDGVVRARAMMASAAPDLNPEGITVSDRVEIVWAID